MTQQKVMNPEALAAQLRRPQGEAGAVVAASMNKANQSVNQRSISLLAVSAHEQILEIGPGNAAFAADIVNAAPGVHYTGIDWSADMVSAARLLNSELITQQRASFYQGDARQIPFADNAFDKILSVHTLYFWKDPVGVLAEIARLLKPGGLFCLAWSDQSFMEKLPFTAYGFTLHGIASVQSLLATASLAITCHTEFTERGLSNTGETVDKIIHIILCRKI